MVGTWRQGSRRQSHSTLRDRCLPVTQAGRRSRDDCEMIVQGRSQNQFTLQLGGLSGGRRRAAAKECLYLFDRNLSVLIGVDRFEDLDMGCLDFLK